MATDRDIEVSCRRCGRAKVRIGTLSVARSGTLADGLVGFCCPLCSHEALQAVDDDIAIRLLLLGASEMAGPRPFELTEGHEGSPLSWDDVLDAHDAMRDHCCPQDELAS